MNGETVDETTGEVIDGTLVRQTDELSRLEKRAQLMPRLLELAIKSTHPGQWVNIGDKAWPTGAAAEVMARTCGVKVMDLKRKKRECSDEKGEYYLYECEATFSLASEFDSIEAFGTCSSRDQFLGTGEPDSEKRKIWEVDEGNISKSAYTNMLINGITRLLGVRNMSWERLGKAGIGKDGVASVEFDTGSKGGGRKAAGSDLVLKFGSGKDKTIGEQTDGDLAWYIGIFEKDLVSDEPKKVQHRKNTEKQLAAAKAEQAARANAKAGTAAKPTTTEPTFWERLKDYAKASGVAEDRLKELTKHALKKDKVNPSELTQEDFTTISIAVAAEAKAAAAKKEEF